MFGPSSGEEVLIVAATHKVFAGGNFQSLDLQKIIQLDMKQKKYRYMGWCNTSILKEYLDE